MLRYSLGPRRAFAPNAWSSRDFAAHTAGILTEMGYKTKPVSSPGWSGVPPLSRYRTRPLAPPRVYLLRQGGAPHCGAEED